MALPIFASVLLSSMAFGDEPPKVGEVFPDLSFPALEESGLHSLSDYRGTKVLLIQFASW